MENKIHPSIVKSAPFGYAYHELILDSQGKPFDFRYLEVNNTFEKLTGLNASEILGRTVKEIIPGFENDKFDWISFYGRIALTCSIETLEQYSEPLGRWYHIQAYSTKRGFFTTIFVDISSQKKEEEKFYKAFHMNPMAQIVTLMPDGTIIAANDAFCRLTGYARERLINRTPRQLGLWNNPRDRAKMYDSLDSSMSIKGYEIEARVASGDVRNWVLSAEQIELRTGPCMITAIEDITEKRKAQEELKLSAEIMANMAEGVMLVRQQDGIMVFTNPKIERMFGYDPGEMPGLHVSVVNAPGGRTPGEIAQEIEGILKMEGSWSGDVHNIRKNGETFWCHANISGFHHREYGVVWVNVLTDITDKIRAEELLQQREKQINFVFEKSNTGAWDFDLKNHVALRSAEHARIFGYKDHQSLWTYDMFLDHVVPEDRNVVEPILKDALKNKTDWNFECRIRRADGKIRWIWVVGGHLFDEKGDPYTASGIVQDITERKEAEELIRESEERYHSLFTHLAEGYALCRMHYDEKGEACDWTYLDLNPAFEQLTGLKGAKGKLVSEVIPGIREADPGLFEIYNRVALTGEHEKFEMYVNALEDWFSLSVYSPQKEYFVAVFDVITERKKAESNQKIMLTKYRTLFESLPVGIIIADEAGKIVEGNRMAEEILSLTREEQYLRTIDGKEWKMVHLDGTPLPPEEFPSVKALKERRVIENTEMGILQQNGETTWISVTACPLFMEGNSVLVAFQDISGRIEAEKEYRRSEENFSKAFQSSPAALLITRFDDGRIREANEAYCEVTGYKKEDLIGKITSDQNIYVQTGDRKTVIKALAEKGYLRDYEFTIRHRSGELRIVIASQERITFRDEDCIMSSLIDITKRKNAENELRESEMNLALALDAARMGTWEVEMATGKVRWSELHEKMLGFLPGNFPGNMASFEERLFPEDRERLNRVGEAALQERTPFQLDYRFNTPDGEMRWISSHGQYVFDDDGNPVRIIGVAYDITERKLAEKALKESEERFRALVDRAPDGIFVQSNGRVRYVNQAMAAILGANVTEELLGTDYVKWIPDEYKNIIKGRIRYQTKTGKPVPPLEMEYLKIDGSRIAVETSAVPLLFGGQKAHLVFVRDISSRKKAQEEVGRFRTMTDQAMHGSTIADTNGTLIYVNDYFAKTHGYLPGEMVGKNLTMCHSNEQLDTVRQLIGILRETGKFDLTEVWHQRKDGSTFPMLMNGVLLKSDDGFSHYLAATAIDITEQKQSEDQIRKLSQAVEQSPVCIVITDTEGTIEYVNPRFTELTGYKFEEAIGKNPSILKSGEMTDKEYKVLWDTLLAGNIWHGEFHNKKKNGQLYWENASISPIRNVKGAITHYLAVKEDITDQKKTQHELMVAKEKAEESNRLKSAFLANMSHEIRTPMNAILGFLNLLKNMELSNEKKNEYIGIVNKSGQRLLTTINDIIEMAKIETGHIDVPFTETNTEEILNELCNFFKPQAAEKGVAMTCKIKIRGDKALCLTNKQRLEGILINLINNALKFTSSGTIEVGGKFRGNNLLFYVKDTGIGIPPDKLDAIFERFVQADLKITSPHEGSGLGLAIAKAYVEMLNGKLWVESNVGEGSTFFFTIPYHPVVTSDPVIETTVNMKQNFLNGVKILIAEDDEMSYCLLENILQQEGAVVKHVITGKGAVEALRKEKDFNLVLMDIRMPEMSGIEATQKIRKFNKKIPVIAQTAYAFSVEKNTAIEAGCTDYLIKPIDPDELLTTIRKYL